MRCLAHLSDLHFGTEDPRLVQGLIEDLQEENPSLAIISGDFTQRARTNQFEAARSFLAQLPCPWLGVPGNHDVPLYDVFRRFAAPLARYKAHIAQNVDVFYEDPELLIAGVNTARSLTWKSGRISFEQIEWLRKNFEFAPPTKFKIVVTHHPFIPPPGEPASGIDLVGRAADALPVLDRAGVDLLLAGHLHLEYSGDVRTHYPAQKRSMIVVQAGTAISRRIREQPNGYNILRLRKDLIDVEVKVWDGSAFKREARRRYQLEDQEWKLASVDASEGTQGK